MTPQKINTETKFHGKGYIVEKVNYKYYLQYIKASQGGGSRKFEVSKEVFDKAKKEKSSLRDLFTEYDLYRFDIPANDIKS